VLSSVHPVSQFLGRKKPLTSQGGGNSLTILNSIGPFLAKTIVRWLERSPGVPTPPEIRGNFIFMSEAKRGGTLRRRPRRGRARTHPRGNTHDRRDVPAPTVLLTRYPEWRKALKGDLQMHTKWSDGSGTIAVMAAAGVQSTYGFIDIMDHAKGLRIAGGIDERALAAQGKEIARINAELTSSSASLRVLRSVELNLRVDGKKI
jgi:hypothetical protein